MDWDQTRQVHQSTSLCALLPYQYSNTDSSIVVREQDQGASIGQKIYQTAPLCDDQDKEERVINERVTCLLSFKSF